MKLYDIYGLKILSEIELPATISQSSDFDAEIVYGNVDYPPQNYVSKGVCFYARRNEVFFEIKDIARYYIFLGKRIVVQPFEKADKDSIVLFLNGPVIGALLLQKGYFPLHAGAFEYNGKAVLVAGYSGIGKSSLIAHMSTLGYSIIADDISAIEMDSNVPVVHSSGNYLKLWKDTLQKLELNSENLKKARKNLEKFLYPVKYSEKSWRIEKIYIMKSHNLPEIKISDLKGIDKFVAIKDNIYRRIFIKGLEIEKDFFTMAMQMAMTIKVSEVVRPNTGFVVTELAESILKDLESNGRDR